MYSVEEFNPYFGSIYVSKYTGNIGIYLENGEEYFSDNIEKITSNNKESNLYISFLKSWYYRNVLEK